MGKPELNLEEPDQALICLKAFGARARVETRRDIDATPGTTGPPAFAAIPNGSQVTDFFMSFSSFNIEPTPNDLKRAEFISQLQLSLHMRKKGAPIVTKA